MSKSTDRPSEGVWRKKGRRTYNINFRWRGGRHNYSAYSDAKLSARLRQDVLRLLERHGAGEAIDTRRLNKRSWEILAKLKVVNPPTTTDAAELVARYCRFLRAKGDSLDYVDRIESRLLKLLVGCKIKRITDIKADAVQIYIGNIAAGIATKNHYLRSAKSFAKWLMEHEYLASDVLARLHLSNAEADRKIMRRAMTDAEFDRLIKYTVGTDKLLDAQARQLTYKIARYAGLRAKEVASLVAHSLEGNALVVKATNTKNKREARQIIPGWLADEIRRYCQGRTGELFGGKWYRKAAEMLRADLTRAGIKAVDERGHKLDYHALRHSFVTGLVLAGVSPKDAQTLARHSTITLTMEIYTHLDDMERLAGIVEASMPERMPTGCTNIHTEAQQRTTGRIAG